MQNNKIYMTNPMLGGLKGLKLNGKYSSHPWWQKLTEINLFDTAFGDRLVFWAMIHQVSLFIKRNDLIVPEYWWPELLFIDLPNTRLENISYNTLKEFSSIEFDSFLKLMDNNNCIDDTETDFYFNLSIDNISRRGIKYHFMDELFYKIGEIKFKNAIVDNYFKNNFSNVISIHLRRGFSISMTKEFIESSSVYIDRDKLLSFYGKIMEYNSNYMQDNMIKKRSVLPDDFYFYLIDKILKKNKNQKIYLSTDVPLELLSHYIEKYPNNIVTYKNYINEFLDFYDKKFISENNDLYFYPLDKCSIALVDFFAIANSKVNISTWSQWSFLSSKYKDKIIIDAEKEYKKIFKK
jgi:hypothetical protein